MLGEQQGGSSRQAHVSFEGFGLFLREAKRRSRGLLFLVFSVWSVDFHWGVSQVLVGNTALIMLSNRFERHGANRIRARKPENRDN